MLTDIFAYRYSETPLWDHFDESARRLLVQSFRIVSEQLYPYYSNGNERSGAKVIWDGLNKQLAMELGLKDLSSTVWGFYNPQKIWISGVNSPEKVCERFVCAEYDNSIPADDFIKERLSFVELAFRRRHEEIAKINLELPAKINKAKIDSAKPSPGFRWPGKLEDSVRATNEALNTNFSASCEELNTRFRQAKAKLNYHNGFIQISSDRIISEQIESPFWALIAGSKWRSVDHDMKEAIDQRDSGGRDPALHAAKALESTLKIISGEKGWTTGQERDANSFLNNLRAKKNGGYINDWENKLMTEFFSSVRNPFGHGSGSEPIPELSMPQTDWAIEFCMSWIKNLIRRM